MYFRTVLKSIKKSLEGHIVLDCDADLIPIVFKQAKEVNLLDDYRSFIITSLVRINYTAMFTYLYMYYRVVFDTFLTMYLNIIVNHLQFVI